MDLVEFDPTVRLIRADDGFEASGGAPRGALG